MIDGARDTVYLTEEEKYVIPASNAARSDQGVNPVEDLCFELTQREAPLSQFQSAQVLQEVH